MKTILKTILFYGLITALFTFGLTSCSNSNSLGHVSMVDNYASVDDLIKDSPVIVSGTVTSPNKEFEYGHVPFSLTQFRVETALRGEVPGTINILQTKSYEDPFIKKGDKMILFLVKYVGPVAEDSYRLKGLYMGQYQIQGTSIIKNKDNNLSGDSVLENLETLKSRIDLIGYEPKSTPPISN
jgi:hypothetical protein